MGVPGSPEKIGRGSLIRIVSHPLDLTLPKIAGPFRGGLMKGEVSFACSTFSPLNCHSSSREEGLAPESFAPQYTSSIL